MKILQPTAFGVFSHPIRGPAGNQFSLYVFERFAAAYRGRQLRERHLSLGINCSANLVRAKCFLVEEHADAVRLGIQFGGCEAGLCAWRGRRSPRLSRGEYGFEARSLSDKNGGARPLMPAPTMHLPALTDCI
jgi:hypothetical protein